MRAFGMSLVSLVLIPTLSRPNALADGQQLIYRSPTHNPMATSAPS
jgi:hypothetical protein